MDTSHRDGVLGIYASNHEILMAPIVRDEARASNATKPVAAPVGAVGTQRVFNAHYMFFAQDAVDPHITTSGRGYGPASIVGTINDADDVGHSIVNAVLYNEQTITYDGDIVTYTAE